MVKDEFHDAVIGGRGGGERKRGASRVESAWTRPEVLTLGGKYLLRLFTAGYFRNKRDSRKKSWANLSRR